MYYEVYLDFYFLESFLTDVALLILVKTVMRGQLMRGPQVFAYLIQLDRWFKKYRVELV